VFGLTRVLNLAHGVIYLFGAYVGHEAIQASDSWLLAVLAGGWPPGCSGCSCTWRS
jgi:branched-chain amino acid transport system permease protein